jgi:hypothetical protein
MSVNQDPVEATPITVFGVGDNPTAARHRGRRQGRGGGPVRPAHTNRRLGKQGRKHYSHSPCRIFAAARPVLDHDMSAQIYRACVSSGLGLIWCQAC